MVMMKHFNNFSQVILEKILVSIVSIVSGDVGFSSDSKGSNESNHYTDFCD